MIKFGTDGWRAKIGEEFTFDNLGKVAAAYAVSMLEKKSKPEIAVGYDNRFMSEKYAKFTADMLAGYGFRVHLFDAAVPTPMVSFAVTKKGFDGGLMITSSHNPYDYNGFKIKNESGAGASPAVTDKVEKIIASGRKPAAKKGSVTAFNIDAEYVRNARKLVDIDLIKKSGLRVAADYMFGSGIGYFEKIIGDYKKISFVNAKRDPMFGGLTPEPIRKNLVNLMAEVKRTKADIGIAVDGDGDRMALVDENGEFLTTHKALVFQLLHHAKHKKMKFKFVKTISGTFLIDRVAEDYGIEVEETPVGFKYIGEKIIADKNVIGGEESGGIGFGYYIPERDGIVSNLLILEFLAKEKKSLRRIIGELHKKHGRFMYDRIDVKFRESSRKALIDTANKLEFAGKIAGKKITSVSRIDGIKYIISGNEWILFRFSGTEPLLRIYSEGPSNKDVKANLDFGLRAVKTYL